MKVKIILLIIFLGIISLANYAQDKNTPSVGSVNDSGLIPSYVKNNISSQDKAAQATISRTKMAEQRKYFDCPDILIPVVPADDMEASFFLPDPVFFRINLWVIDPSEWAKIELAAKFLNDNPRSVVEVTGFADKKTGNPRINMFLSRQRANAIAKALQQKYDISRERISISWKGDLVQPFEYENDKNRAVLFLMINVPKTGI